LAVGSVTQNDWDWRDHVHAIASTLRFVSQSRRHVKRRVLNFFFVSFDDFI
jgi:hypothetical protein